MDLNRHCWTHRSLVKYLLLLCTLATACLVAHGSQAQNFDRKPFTNSLSRQEIISQSLRPE